MFDVIMVGPIPKDETLIRLFFRASQMGGFPKRGVKVAENDGSATGFDTGFRQPARRRAAPKGLRRG